jgi:hypothetical protein
LVVVLLDAVFLVAVRAVAVFDFVVLDRFFVVEAFFFDFFDVVDFGFAFRCGRGVRFLAAPIAAPESAPITVPTTGAPRAVPATAPATAPLSMLLAALFSSLDGISFLSSSGMF